MSTARLLAKSFRSLAYCRRHVSSAAAGSTANPLTGTAKNSRVDTILGARVDPTSLPKGVTQALSLDNASKAEARRIRKMRLIEQFRRSESDTGSPEVQIAILTDRIKDLTGHVQQHKQDKANRRSLVMLVHKRRKLMKYLLRESAERYMIIVKALGLRPSSVFSKDVSLGAKKAPTPKLH